jgi:excisionase family DNA binding protein
VPDDELTTAQAAALLGVDTSTVWRMAKRGELPYRLTPAEHRRYPRPAVEAAAERLRAGLPPVEAAERPGLESRVGSLEDDMARVKRHLGLDDDGG